MLKVYLKDWKKRTDLTSTKVKVKAEEVEALSKDLLELEIKHAQLESKSALIDTLLNDIKYNRMLSRWGVFFGILISYVGFFRWYRLVQKPNDMLLRKQLDDLK